MIRVAFVSATLLVAGACGTETGSGSGLTGPGAIGGTGGGGAVGGTAGGGAVGGTAGGGAVGGTAGGGAVGGAAGGGGAGGGTGSCESGVTPLAMLPYGEASPTLDGAPETDGDYDGITAKVWNGNVILGPAADPNGSGRTVNLHRIMEAAPYAWGTTHRAELLWLSNDLYDFPPGVDTWLAFAVMRKAGESQPSASSDDSLLVVQSHTPESGDTGPPYALVMSRQSNLMSWRVSYNEHPSSDWSYNGGSFPDRYDAPAQGVEPLMPEGVWYRYILHYRAGYAISDNPITEVWRAEPGGAFELLFSYTGLNAYNGANGYPRIGPYKWGQQWFGQSSLAFYETPLYYGRGANLYDAAEAALCGLP